MGSADLPEAAATRQQNLYAVSQGCAVFVFVRVSAKQHAALMFYREPLSFSDDAKEWGFFPRTTRILQFSSEMQQT
jgi:hypothetical protein